MSESTVAFNDLKEQEIRKWDTLAAGWVRWWGVFERAAQPVSDRLVELARIAPGHVVLDIATGVGEPAVTAARCAGPRGRVIATDCAAMMLREAAARAKAMDVTNIEFREMDAAAPNFGHASFDALLCRWGLMFVPDLEESVKRFLALLRPHGRFATAVWGTLDDVPVLRTSTSVLAERAPLPDGSVSPLNAFRLSERGLLEEVMSRAGFVDIVREELRVTFEFASAKDYTRFRRDVTSLDSLLAKHHRSDVVEAAWQAVTNAAQAYANRDGRVRFTNTVVCVSGSR